MTVIKQQTEYTIGRTKGNRGSVQLWRRLLIFSYRMTSGSKDDDSNMSFSTAMRCASSFAIDASPTVAGFWEKEAVGAVVLAINASVRVDFPDEERAAKALDGGLPAATRRS